MRAKLDENIPVEAVRILVDAGWDVATVHDENMVGAEDHLLAAACQAEGRVLFSLDLDFADIRAYPPGEYDGIVVCSSQPLPQASGPGRDHPRSQ